LNVLGAAIGAVVAAERLAAKKAAAAQHRVGAAQAQHLGHKGQDLLRFAI